MKVEHKTVLPLFAIIFLDQTYITLTFPLVTLIFFDEESRLFAPAIPHAVRSFWYGICIALPNLLNMFFTPILSTFSDVFGRKKVLLFSIFSAFIFTASVGLGVYTGILSLIFFGYFIRGAFARINPTALAVIGDTIPRPKKVLYMGYVQFSIAIGACLGPILGGYLAHHFFFPIFNFSFPFFIAAVLAILNTIFTLSFLRESLSKAVGKQQLNWQNFKDVLLHREVLTISVILFFIQIAWSTYYQFMPPLLKTVFQFDAEKLGWFIGLIGCFLAIATSVGIKFLQQWLNVRQLLLFSVYLVFFGLLITIFACTGLLKHPLWVWSSALPVAAGDVMAYSCLTALYSNLVPADKQGKVMGVSFIVVGISWALTGFFGGLLMSISPFLPILLAPLALLFGLLLIHSGSNKRLVTIFEA